MPEPVPEPVQATESAPEPEAVPVQENTSQSAAETEDESSDSSTYVQRYNDRGYPINRASRVLARRLRHAQNDVLATVGVCVGKDEDHMATVHRRSRSNPEVVGLIVSENEVGLGVAAADLSLMFICLWWTSAVRARLQVGLTI
jgi:hypothetical protein